MRTQGEGEGGGGGGGVVVVKNSHILRTSFMDGPLQVIRMQMQRSNYYVLQTWF